MVSNKDGLIALQAGVFRLQRGQTAVEDERGPGLPSPKTKLPRALALHAAVYSLWFDQRHMLTGNHMIDGSFSVLLGLLICSRPAGRGSEKPLHSQVAPYDMPIDVVNEAK